LKLGSLFSGSGTCELAATLCGIEPVWASEIEKFPIEVTTKRFPNMKHLGDITKISGAEIEPVDIISGGSPCQDVSVAGKRGGLNAERSGLFFEYIRIVKEMLEATNGEYPKIILFENVPGLLSSNKGADYMTVLSEFQNLGFIPDPGIFDAQFMGVPQRRKRVFIVCVNGSTFQVRKTNTSLTISMEILVQILQGLWVDMKEVLSKEPENLEQGIKIEPSDTLLTKRMLSLEKTLGKDVWLILQKSLKEQTEQLGIEQFVNSDLLKMNLDITVAQKFGHQKTDIQEQQESLMDNEKKCFCIEKLLRKNMDEIYEMAKSSITQIWTRETMKKKICLYAETMLNIAEYISHSPQLLQNCSNGILLSLILMKEFTNYANKRLLKANGIMGRDLDFKSLSERISTNRIEIERNIRNECAGEILFKPESVYGNFTQSDESEEGITENTERSSYAASGYDGFNFALTGDTSFIVGVNCGLSTGKNGIIEKNMKKTAGGNDTSATLCSAYGTKWNGNAGAYNGDNFVLDEANEDVICVATQQTNAEIMVDKCPTITKAAGTSGNNKPFVCLPENLSYGVVSKGNGEAFLTKERHMSLSVGGGQAGQGYPCVLTEEVDGIGISGQIAVTLDANSYKGCDVRGGIEREVVLTAGFIGGQGAKAGSIGYAEEQSPTLRSEQDVHVVTYDTLAIHQNADGEVRESEVAYAINTNSNASGRNVPLVYSFDSLSSNSMKSQNSNSGCREVDVAKTIDTSSQDPSKNQGGIAVVYGIATKQFSQNIIENVSPPIMANDYKEPNAVAVLPTDCKDVCYGIDQQGSKGQASYTTDVSPTLCSDSHGTPHAVCYKHCPKKRLGVAFACNQRDEVRDLEDCAGALQAQPGMKQQTFCIQGNTIERSDNAGANGKGVLEDLSYTLNTTDRHAVSYGIGNGQVDQTKLNEEVVGCLNCMHEQQAIIVYENHQHANYREGVGTLRVAGGDLGGGSENLGCKTKLEVAGVDCRNATENKELSATLQAKPGGGISLNCTHPVRVGHSVRRLTPHECQRLQGFPDFWVSDVAGSDTAVYKMYGNGMALPCVLYIMQNIANICRDEGNELECDAVSKYLNIPNGSLA